MAAGVSALVTWNRAQHARLCVRRVSTVRAYESCVSMCYRRRVLHHAHVCPAVVRHACLAAPVVVHTNREAHDEA
jgi:hypothetical protein